MLWTASTWRSSRRHGRAPQGRGRGTAAAETEPLPFEYHEGFDSIFDGKTLKGWDGDPRFWRAENGAIVGETTADKKLKKTRSSSGRAASRQTSS